MPRHPQYLIITDDGQLLRPHFLEEIEATLQRQKKSYTVYKLVSRWARRRDDCIAKA